MWHNCKVEYGAIDFRVVRGHFLKSAHNKRSWFYSEVVYVVICVSSIFHPVLAAICSIRSVPWPTRVTALLKHIEVETKWSPFSTHWGRDKLATFFQTIFWKGFSWMKLYEFRLELEVLKFKFVPRGPINNIPALVQIMAWRRPGDKPLSEPMMVSLLMHICATRPQWVKGTDYTIQLFQKHYNGGD